MNSTKTLLRGDTDHPYHLSIGQIILRDNRVALIRKKDGVTTLPRETTYLEESFLETIMRGGLEGVVLWEDIDKAIEILERQDNPESGIVKLVGNV